MGRPGSERCARPPRPSAVARAAAACLAAAALACGACGARSSFSDVVPDAGVTAETGCTAAPPTCVARGLACTVSTVVPAVCDGGSRVWACPAGSSVYARAPAPTAPCLPFHGASGLANVGPWGIGSFSRIPTDDGRCLWLADSVTLSDGAPARNVALEADPDAPFGTCPVESVAPPAPLVTMEGGDDPSILVQVDGGYRLGGATHVLYRLFRVDPTAVYGVTELGGGVARLDAATGRIVIPSLARPFPWGLDLDLGDATLPSGDGAHELVWGCAPPGAQLFEEGCRLARLDALDAVELYAKSGDWIASVRASDGATVFQSGRWMSSVVPPPESPSSALRHVYIGDFGDELRTQSAPVATGPWSDAASLGPCDLPASDPQAFCASPVVHDELADPTRPGEIAVTYGVGSTGAGVRTGNPEDYWPRLVWVP